MRMRSIQDAYQEFAEKDPNSAITKTGFRRLVNEGRIPFIQIGRKKVLRMEDVYAFLEKGNSAELNNEELQNSGRLEGQI